MKTERIRLLVTVAVRHDGTRADRREAIAEARENVRAVHTPNRAEPKGAVLLERDAVIMPLSVWKLASERPEPLPKCGRQEIFP